MAPLARLRTVPWLLALQAALAAGERWRTLSERERSRLVGLVRDARGWPGNLTAKERDELRRLVGKLDLPGIGRELLPMARKRRRRS